MFIFLPSEASEEVKTFVFCISEGSGGFPTVIFRVSEGSDSMKTVVFCIFYEVLSLFLFRGQNIYIGFLNHRSSMVCITSYQLGM